MNSAGLRRKAGRVRPVVAAAVVAAAAVFSPAVVSGQALAPGLVDSRVRVELTHHSSDVEGFFVARQMVRGTVVEQDGEALTLRLHPEAGPVRVSLAGVYRIDVSGGVSRPRSALVRGLSWGVTSAAWTVRLPVSETDLEAMAFMGAVGFVTGAVVGAVFPRERWLRVWRR